jgi:hypothetical protein
LNHLINSNSGQSISSTSFSFLDLNRTTNQISS